VILPPLVFPGETHHRHRLQTHWPSYKLDDLGLHRQSLIEIIMTVQQWLFHTLWHCADANLSL